MSGGLDSLIIVVYPMIIGERIKMIVRQRGMSVVDFANAISCSRETAHRLFHKRDVNISLLKRVSKVLEHDFFKDISERDIN